ncbi:MAG TPA: T9SS type A sorting domain-containing protein, partial [Chitinophagaceae bacterium]|nr:T9SS type A sorting domain-containing protein [Chitinophagaceae bacterium]
TESTVNEPFTVTDNAGDVVTVTATLPPFVTLESLGGSSYRLVATPGTQYVGLFNATIIAKDDKGGTTTRNIVIQAADKRTRSFYVNFGSDGKAGGAPWNDFLGFMYATRQLQQLKDEAGVVTGLSIRCDDNWTNTFDLGMMTGNNSGSFPDSVLRSGIFYDQTGGRRFTFSGLDPTKRYNVVFMGSWNDGVTAGADYSVTGQTASLNARYNTNRTAQLNALAPTASGTLQVTATKQNGVVAMYLNGIVLEEYTDTILLMNPIRLYAEPTGKTSVTLYWADRTNIETGYEVYRATSAAGPWTLVTTTGANVTTYVNNTNLSANTRYFYRVRARRNTGPSFSQFSNVAETITPKSISYVNLTFTYPQGGVWNNFNANPDVDRSIADIKNDVNVSTGLTMTITRQFNGQYDAGMQTGSGIYPDNVMRSNYWLDRTQLGQFRVTGLNHSKRYRFGFFGSAGPGWDGDYTSTYTIGNRTVYLNAHRNDSKTVFIGDVVPDANGEVLLNLSTTAEAAFGFTAAIIIQSYDDPVGGTVENRTNKSDDELIVADDKAAEGRTSVVAQAPAVEDEMKNIRVLAYPNPFTNNLKIDFYNSSVANQVSVDIVDMSGRLVLRKDAGKVPMGMNTMRLDVGTAVAPGMYIVRLTINGKVVNTSKLVKSDK